MEVDESIVDASQFGTTPGGGARYRFRSVDGELVEGLKPGTTYYISASPVRVDYHPNWWRRLWVPRDNAFWIGVGAAGVLLIETLALAAVGVWTWLQ